LHKEGWERITLPLVQKGKMIKTIRATFKLKGTEKGIERIKARIAVLSTYEEVISLYMGEEEQYIVE
jgi:hypothetical protein